MFLSSLFSSNYHLLLHNILFFGGGLVNIVAAFTVLYLRRHNVNNLVVTFMLMTLSVATFQISHVLGVNAPTAEISRQILMWNLSVIPINIFMAHWFLALVEKTKERRPYLILIYVTGIALLLIHIFMPSTYLLPSTPKMYFPFYYVAGPLQWVTRLWFNMVGAYYFVEMLIAYHYATDPIKKNRYMYVILDIVFGFVVGSTAILLIYNIPFDPMWSAFFSLYILPIAYAIVRYQLLDIKVVIQRTFIYAVSVTILISLISFSNLLNEIIVENVPGFPRWIISLVSAGGGVVIGMLVWNKLRQNDRLKYEFITIIAHKFRTPLTQTKWSIEELVTSEQDSSRLALLDNIKHANSKLVDLTGALIELADTDRMSEVLYNFKRVDLCVFLRHLVQQYEKDFKEKNIMLGFECLHEGIVANIDEARFTFVLQTLIENALSYTPVAGRVTMKAFITASRIHIEITDTGIGISRSDMPMVFSKFYRTQSAKRMDTEGVGVGLFLARSIMERHGGTIKASSEGDGQGSTFTIILPRTWLGITHN